MKIAITIVYIFATINIAHANFYRIIYIDEVIQGILQSTDCQDVIIRIQKHDIQDRAEHVLDVVARNAATTRPLQILVSEELLEFNFHPASSRTLLIYIYTSNNDINDAQMNALLYDINWISYPKHVPKLLLIIDSKKNTLNGQRQLEYLWDHKFFDVIILEVSFSRFLEPTFTAVHRFNGFNNDYSRVIVYENDTVWFPNKLRDIYGATFKVTFEEVPPYGTLENNTVGGLAKLFMNVLSNAINATVVHTSNLQDNDMTYNAEALVYADSYSTQHEHTVTIDDDRICALVPAIPASKVLVDFWRIIITILFGFLLAAVVWCVSFIINVSERVRDPLNTISLIVGMTPLHEPRSLVEKILFIAVVMTVAEYMIIFQAELLEFVVEFASTIRVSTFRDLYDTGLKVVVSPVVHDELAAAEDLSPEFMKRFINSAELQNKYGTVDTSKAYFTSEISGKLAEIRLKREGKRLFKLTDLCILSHYRVHRLHMRSSFKNEVNRILLALEESGFPRKLIDDFWKDDKWRRKSESRISLSDHSVYVAFFVIIVGDVISFIVFLGEIITNRFFKRNCFSCFYNYCKSMKMLKRSKINKNIVARK